MNDVERNLSGTVCPLFTHEKFKLDEIPTTAHLYGLQNPNKISCSLDMLLVNSRC